MKDNHLKIIVQNHVYPPSEDTFLLLDAIEVSPSESFLEVGCGSGYILANAASISFRAIGLDFSFAAVRNTKQNLLSNNMEENAEVLLSDLLDAFLPNTRFDVIVFNPPYLPSDEDGTGLDHALIGGIRGSEITERFVRQAMQHLSPSGRIYTIVSSLSGHSQLERCIEDAGFEMTTVESGAFFFERLSVIRVTSSRKPFYKS
jgi:release factor glutamine methyltransferase